MATATFDQDAFRARNDDGDEATATWIAAANTDWTQAVDTNFRVRFLIQVAGANINSVQFQLQYNLNAAGWLDVNASSSVVISSAGQLVDGGDTTQQLGVGTFAPTDNNGQDEVDGLTALASGFIAGQESETEHCVQIVSADVVNNDSIQLRLVREADLAFDTYTNTPTITVSEAVAAATGGSLMSWLRRRR